MYYDGSAKKDLAAVLKIDKFDIPAYSVSSNRSIYHRLPLAGTDPMPAVWYVCDTRKSNLKDTLAHVYGVALGIEQRIS